MANDRGVSESEPIPVFSTAIPVPDSRNGGRPGSFRAIDELDPLRAVSPLRPALPGKPQRQ